MKERFSLKKHVCLLSAALLLGGVFSYSAPVNLQVGYDDPSSTTPGHAKVPVRVPSLELDNHVITFVSNHANFTLELYQDGVLVHSVFVSDETAFIGLPSWLSGEYELQLIPEGSSFYYVGTINL